LSVEPYTVVLSWVHQHSAIPGREHPRCQTMLWIVIEIRS